MTYSIVVPVYNVEQYLAECLDSVLVQKFSGKYEIILVDDGSTDSSGGICDAYAEKYSCIRVLHTENQGVSAARNLGMDVAQGDYLLFIDSDDLWAPDFLNTFDLLVNNLPDAVFIRSEDFSEDGCRKEVCPPCYPQGEQGKAWMQECFSKKGSPPVGIYCYGLRRNFVEDNQLRFSCEVQVAEDSDFNFRMLGAAKSVLSVDRILYYRRIHSGSLIHSMTPKKYFDSLFVHAQNFRRYPAAMTADGYCLIAAQVACLGSRKMEEDAICFILENWDIWNHVSFLRTKIARILLQIFGCHYGSVIWLTIRRIKYWIMRQSDWTIMKDKKTDMEKK